MRKSKKPRRRWFRDMTTADYVLSVIGLCLGTAAALFPWHVYLNPDSYGPPRMTFSRGGVIPAEEVAAQQATEIGDPTGPLSDAGTANRVAGATRPPIDPVTTGKVDRGAIRSDDIDQPYPGNGKEFRVLAVDGARALVGDAEGVYLVRVQSRLPDGTIAMEFREDGEGWFIVTSGGRNLRPN